MSEDIVPNEEATCTNFVRAQPEGNKMVARDLTVRGLKCRQKK